MTADAAELPPRGDPSHLLARLTSVVDARRIWDLSERLVGVDLAV